VGMHPAVTREELEVGWAEEITTMTLADVTTTVTLHLPDAVAGRHGDPPLQLLAEGQG